MKEMIARFDEVISTKTNKETFDHLKMHIENYYLPKDKITEEFKMTRS